MQFKSSIQHVFAQLSDSIIQLTNEEYCKPGKILFNASVGQHVRHIIELYICLYNGYETSRVNYDDRKRDVRIETDKDFAKELMLMISNNLEKPDKALILYVASDENTNEPFAIKTNYYRELIYNLEHTIHHMALIRIGINEVSAIQIPVDFGVAISTIKYRRSCAQ